MNHRWTNEWINKDHSPCPHAYSESLENLVALKKFPPNRKSSLGKPHGNNYCRQDPSIDSLKLMGRSLKEKEVFV